MVYVSKLATVIAAGTVTTAEKEPVAFVVIVGAVRVIDTGVPRVVLSNVMVIALVAAKPVPVRVIESPGSALVGKATRAAVTVKAVPAFPDGSDATIKWSPLVAGGIVTRHS